MKTNILSKKDDILAEKKQNGGATISKIFDLLQSIDVKNEISHGEIKVEIQKNRNELTEKVGELRERLTKIESQPAHEVYQQRACPNTQAIEEIREVGSKGLREYVELHRGEHNILCKKIDAILEELKDIENESELKVKAVADMYEKKLDKRDLRARRALWAGIIALATIAIPAIIELAKGL